MDEEKKENANSTNSENELDENIELDALKAKYTDLLSKNKHLFARAKKAEGFELQDDGSYVKVEKSKAKDSVKSDDKLLERLDKMALQVAGITEADEVEHLNKWKDQTGREADDIVGNSIFKKEIEEIRTAKANLKATSEIKGERGESGVRDTPEYWIAKATKGADGKPLFPEETPPEMFAKIVEKLGEKEPGASKGKLKFYNK